MITRTLTMLASILLIPAISIAEDCHCSCSSFVQLKAEVARFEQQLDQDRIAVATPELQSSLQCINPCAERWMQCTNEDDDSSSAATRQLVQSESTAPRIEKADRQSPPSRLP